MCTMSLLKSHKRSRYGIIGMTIHEYGVWNYENGVWV